MTPPHLPKVLVRARLLALLDQGLERPAVWVHGGAGSGKTTLVASYLKQHRSRCVWYQLDSRDQDPAAFFHYLSEAASPVSRKRLPRWPREPSQDPAAFCRYYFELLFQALPPGTLLVFDDVHELAGDSAWHGLMQHALASMPPDFKLLLISRDEPPSTWLAEVARRRMAVVGGRELAFHADEATALGRLYFKSGGSWALPIEQLHALSQGWVAGLILLFEYVDKGGTLPEAATGLRQLFTALASTMFGRADEKTREFMLKTALLPNFTEEMARELTGEARLLSSLHRQNFFVERHGQGEAEPTYQYHPLLRQFLHEKAAAAWSAEQARAHGLSAAQILLDHGRADEAFELFRRSESWDSMMWLILTTGPKLLRQGRRSTLLRWCEALPREVAGANGWVQYWHAVGQLMGRPGPQARQEFAHAFTLFDQAGDALGMRLACCSVIAAIANEMADASLMDPWIERLQQMAREELELMPVDLQLQLMCTMVMAKTFRELQTEDDWPGRVLSLISKSEDAGQRLFALALMHYHHAWRGEAGAMSVLLEMAHESVRLGEAAPVYWPVPSFIEASYAWLVADHPRCLRAVRQGLALAEKPGIHRWSEGLLTYGMFAAVALSDFAACDELLKKFAELSPTERPTMRMNYHFWLARHAAALDDWPRALAMIKVAVDETRRLGVPALQFFALHLQAGLAWETGQRELAWHDLRKAEAIEQATQNGLFNYARLLTEASFALDERRVEQALAHLEHALQRGKALGVYNAWWPLPEKLGRLCGLALEHELEPEYVRELIARHRLQPPEGGAGLAGWPWPIRIHTLGRFELFLDGAAVKPDGKAQKVPLALLQAVIALGGASPAGASVEEVAESLWPDADGDRANHAFETALYRLRKLLVEDGTVRLTQGRVSLNPRLCWVDVGALQAECSAPSTPAEKALARLLSLYRGPFLPSGPLWAEPLRHKVRQLFLRAMQRLAREASARGHQDQVRALWEELREIEPAARMN